MVTFTADNIHWKILFSLISANDYFCIKNASWNLYSSFNLTSVGSLVQLILMHSESTIHNQFRENLIVLCHDD